MFGGAERTAEGQGDPTAHRADGDHSAVGGPQHRQHGLGHGELAEHIDLVLPTPLVQRNELDRSGHADSGVVDQRVETAQTFGDLGDPAGIGDVELDRGDGLAERLSVSLFTDAGIDGEALAGQQQRGGPPDAGGGTGHEDGR